MIRSRFRRPLNGSVLLVGILVASCTPTVAADADPTALLISGAIIADLHQGAYREWHDGDIFSSTQFGYGHTGVVSQQELVLYVDSPSAAMFRGQNQTLTFANARGISTTAVVDLTAPVYVLYDAPLDPASGFTSHGNLTVTEFGGMPMWVLVADQYDVTVIWYPSPLFDEFRAAISLAFRESTAQAALQFDTYHDVGNELDLLGAERKAALTPQEYSDLLGRLDRVQKQIAARGLISSTITNTGAITLNHLSTRNIPNAASFALVEYENRIRRDLDGPFDAYAYRMDTLEGRYRSSLENWLRSESSVQTTAQLEVATKNTMWTKFGVWVAAVGLCSATGISIWEKRTRAKRADGVDDSAIQG